MVVPLLPPQPTQELRISRFTETGPVDMQGQPGGLIYMSECAYCWAQGIEYNYPDGNPIEVDWGYRDEIRDSYVSNSYTHGPGSTDAAIFLV